LTLGVVLVMRDYISPSSSARVRVRNKEETSWLLMARVAEIARRAGGLDMVFMAAFAITLRLSLRTLGSWS